MVNYNEEYIKLKSKMNKIPEAEAAYQMSLANKNKIFKRVEERDDKKCIGEIQRAIEDGRQSAVCSDVISRFLKGNLRQQGYKVERVLPNRPEDGSSQDLIEMPYHRVSFEPNKYE